MFRDRKDAGQKLARELMRYKEDDMLVLAIARGGTEVGYEVAKALSAGFSILVCRKLPFPDNPEAGFGAIAEDGSSFVFPQYISLLDADTVEKTVKEQKEEIKRRVRILRGGRPLPVIHDRTVILVDDGIAMGSTMRAAIMLCSKKGPKRLIIASPVASQKTEDELKPLADAVVVLEQPPFFSAVAQVYENWHDLTDAEVLEIMDLWKDNR